MQHLHLEQWKTCQIYWSGHDRFTRRHPIRYSRERTFQTLGCLPTPNPTLGQINSHEDRDLDLRVEPAVRLRIHATEIGWRLHVNLALKSVQVDEYADTSGIVASWDGNESWLRPGQSNTRLEHTAASSTNRAPPWEKNNTEVHKWLGLLLQGVSRSGVGIVLLVLRGWVEFERSRNDLVSC